jgi:XTP/dITP diphosphohydrolase
VEPAAWILGEDSGLEVEGLGGRPGVQSARFAAGEHVERLLAELEGVEVRGTGILEGRIGAEPRGSEGFGFDPVFVPDGEEQTVAELGDEWKAENSHRARAARVLRRALEQRRDPPRGLGPATS